ncbi:MAG: AGE family epimerase/isomerase [Pseudobacter sp.]|uniref:AGE family epimerase/isomerase n=1 Tax=Pseudobacter sp. TaxID=2045420 RepID=UPI003F7EE9F3
MMMLSRAQYKTAAEKELHSILNYWMQYTVDNIHGGFHGKIDHNDQVYADALKGSVLNGRICWTFAAAYHFTKDPLHLAFAKRAYDYIVQYFIDPEFGGVYWTVNADGSPADTKKQTYAIAFAVYGISEYALASGDETAKQQAIGLYRTIVQRAYEPVHGGYLEAFARNWTDLPDMRLSAKDANERKTMNTHLHVLEAFANLYRIWPDATLREQIKDLIDIFLHKIIHPQSHHLQLFFTDQWESQSSLISYGHDIEAAWLIQEAAEIINDEALAETVRQRSLFIARAAAEALDKDGGLWYEYDPATDHCVREKHWWPQAEAMVGFYNAWQISANEEFLKMSLNAWTFIQDYLIDTRKGEWIWGVYENYHIIAQEDKAGLWKCPYHNSRACMEIMRRIQ